MKAAHSAASVPIRIHTALSVNTMTIVAMTARASSNTRAICPMPRSSDRAGRAERSWSPAPSVLMGRMLPGDTRETRVTGGIGPSWVGR